MGAHILSSGKL